MEAAQTLVEHDENLRSIYYRSEMAVLVLTPSGIIRKANHNVPKMFGYSHHMLLNMPVQKLFTRSKYLKDAFTTGECCADVKVLTGRHYAGSLFPVQMTRIRYEMDNEQFTVALVSADDLPKKKKIIDPSETQWLRFLNRAMARLWDIHDLQQGLREVLTTSLQLLETSKGNLQLLDKDKQVLRIAVQKGLKRPFLNHFHEVSAMSGSVCGQAFKEKKQIVTNDVNKAAFFARHLKIVQNEGIRAIQSTPLCDHEGEPIAMVSALSPSAGHFDKQRLRRMEVYARSAENFLERMGHEEAIKHTNQALEKKVQERTEDWLMHWNVKRN